MRVDYWRILYKYDHFLEKRSFAINCFVLIGCGDNSKQSGLMIIPSQLELGIKIKDNKKISASSLDESVVTT